MADNLFAPDYKVPPGHTILESINALDLTLSEFTKRMDYDHTFIHELLTSNTPLTPTVAERLEKVLGIPANVWLALEANYRN